MKLYTFIYQLDVVQYSKFGNVFECGFCWLDICVRVVNGGVSLISTVCQSLTDIDACAILTCAPDLDLQDWYVYIQVLCMCTSTSTSCMNKRRPMFTERCVKHFLYGISEIWLYLDTDFLTLVHGMIRYLRVLYQVELTDQSSVFMISNTLTVVPVGDLLPQNQLQQQEEGRIACLVHVY